MTTVKFYRNKRNVNKYLEVHNDGYYHNSLFQFIAYDNGIVNVMGDECLHRWRKQCLDILLSDYIEVNEPPFTRDHNFNGNPLVW